MSETQKSCSDSSWCEVVPCYWIHGEDAATIKSFSLLESPEHHQYLSIIYWYVRSKEFLRNHQPRNFRFPCNDLHFPGGQPSNSSRFLAAPSTVPESSWKFPYFINLFRHFASDVLQCSFLVLSVPMILKHLSVPSGREVSLQGCDCQCHDLICRDNKRPRVMEKSCPGSESLQHPLPVSLSVHPERATLYNASTQSMQGRPPYHYLKLLKCLQLRKPWKIWIPPSAYYSMDMC